MKKFFLIGIIVALLIAVPLTVYILTTQKTTTQSGAAPSTLLSFTIPTDPAVVGTPLAIPVAIDPTNGGSATSPNQISFVKLVITYDGNKLQIANNYFIPDPKFSNVLDGPTNTCDSNSHVCTISATVSTGADPNNAVSSQSTVATLNFNPLLPTDPNTPTNLTFVSGSQALSIAASDKPAENVLALSRLQPGSLVIVAANTTDTPTLPPGQDTPTPSGGGGSGGGSGGGGSGGSGGGTGSSAPISCSSLSASTTSGNAPFTTLLSATGGSTAGNITQITFDFGDGTTQSITSGNGIGTNNASVQQSHVYNTPGTFTATAVFTDDQGNTTTPSSCTQTITVSNGTTSTTPTDTPTPTSTSAPLTPTPTIPATGPGNVFVAVGTVGAIITAIGLLAAFGI